MLEIWRARQCGCPGGRNRTNRRRCSGYPQHSDLICAAWNMWKAHDLSNENHQALDAVEESMPPFLPCFSGGERLTAISLPHLS